MGLEPKRDCFGYKNSSYCGALTEMVCTKRKCSFYKTKEQFIENREIWQRGDIRRGIKKKTYGGIKDA